jgi:predicted MFS family arabinose efflux permease
LRDHRWRFLAYAGFAVLYGICETLNGNWSQQDMTQVHHATGQRATWALTAFWAMVTAGRVFFALARRIKPAWTFHVLPFAIAAVFLLIAALPAASGFTAVVAFGLAGLACSALLPLTISFGQEEMPAAAAAVAGGVIASYQLGYGIAAFGVGPLLDAGWRLPQIFARASLVALALGALSFVVRRRTA